jgi:hypothetical protein
MSKSGAKRLKSKSTKKSKGKDWRSMSLYRRMLRMLSSISHNLRIHKRIRIVPLLSLRKAKLISWLTRL